jgi:hypothetical protein
MKIILSIFCVLMALFGGGCALVLLNASVGILILLPLAIFVLNGLILAALWGWKAPWRPAFYILGAIDLLIAIGIGISLFASALTQDPVGFFFGLAVAAFAIKGILTLVYAKDI